LLSKESLSSEVRLSPLIVASAINLDDEGDLVAEEIDDVRPDRLLSAKFQTG
jgi:hypothetical protein